MPWTTFEKKPKHSWHFEALGTSWEIVTSDPLSREQKRVIQQEVEAFDSTYSRFREDSLVQKLAGTAGRYTFPESAKVIFSLYDDLFDLTRGKVTPLVGDTLVSAGYDMAYSLKPQGTIRSTLNYRDVLKRSGSLITIEEPVTIDIGAVGKGYLIDRISALLLKQGHASFVVDGSGDMRIVGTQTETVGLENPLNPEEAVGMVYLKNSALCASANNRRAWGDWHHIIDPDTSLPTREVIATWIVADTAMVADGLATALFFTDPLTLAKKYTYEYMRMFADGSVEYSDYFAEGVF